MWQGLSLWHVNTQLQLSKPMTIIVVHKKGDFEHTSKYTVIEKQSCGGKEHNQD